MQHRRLRPAIYRGDANQNILDIGLCILDEHIEVAVLRKYAGVEQLKFRLILAATPIFLHQLLRTGNSACGYL